MCKKVGDFIPIPPVLGGFHPPIPPCSWGIHPPYPLFLGDFIPHTPLFLGDTSPIPPVLGGFHPPYPPVSRMSIGYVLGMFWVCFGFMCKKMATYYCTGKWGEGNASYNPIKRFLFLRFYCVFLGRKCSYQERLLQWYLDHWNVLNRVCI